MAQESNSDGSWNEDRAFELSSRLASAGKD
jgi:hypothetical protein